MGRRGDGAMGRWGDGEMEAYCNLKFDIELSFHAKVRVMNIKLPYFA
jgi:hypothetical protein